MKRSGRVHWMAPVAIVGVLALGGMFLFQKENPTTVAAKFMTALAEGDVKTLTQLSYLGKTTPEAMQKKWESCINVGAKYYRFHWALAGGETDNTNIGSVSLKVIPDQWKPGSYEQNFDLPMLIEDGRWKVNVPAISRAMFPYLPR